MADIIPGASAASELCLLLWPYEPAAYPSRAIVQEKFDGIRCLWIGGHLVTREGSPMECAEHARAELEELQRAYGRPMFFDAELVVDDSRNKTLSAFRSRTPKGRLYIFDAVRMEEWRLNRGTAPQDERLEDLSAVATCLNPMGVVRTAPWWYAPRVDAENYYRDFVARKREGIVIKDAAGPYYRGRSKRWMKLTPEVERKHPLREVA
jgi:ATP-dependent DNA ligase